MDSEEESEKGSHNKQHAAGICLISSLAIYSAMRKGNIRVAFLIYQNSGGGGLNFYKVRSDGKCHRTFAIDYHPFWNNQKQLTWKLHYHRGESGNQMKKHRPYEGGW